MKTKWHRSLLAFTLSLIFLFSSFGSAVVLADDDAVAAVEVAINEIGMVSYRESVLSAIEAAEAAWSGLDEAQQGQVSNAQVLVDARAEYDRLSVIASDLQKIVDFDTTTVDGWNSQSCEFELGTYDDHPDHWLITPTGDWSVWRSVEIDLSEYDFDQLKMGINVIRTSEEDGMVAVRLHNAAGQVLEMQAWYGEIGMEPNRWVLFEVKFNEAENSQAGDPWPTWTADDWNMDVPIVTVEFRNAAKTTTPVEADGFAIYNEGADIQGLVDEANAVVDQIAAIGEITSAEQSNAVVAARSAYDNLSAVQQELVVNFNALQQMEQTVSQYRSAANVVAAIDAIGEVTAENYAQKGNAILNARDLYDTYYSEYNDNTLITNFSVLTAAEEAYNGFLDAQKEEDIAALEALIDAIGEVNADNSEEALAKITAAEQARDALAEEYGQSVLNEVGNLTKLEEARRAYDALNSSVTLGDIDEDGNINASDALRALQHSVELITLEGDPFTAADVNRNSVVDAADALLILQYSVDLITEFPSAE